MISHYTVNEISTNRTITTTTFKEGHVDLCVKRQANEIIVCPCCGRSLECKVYPGLRVGDALRFFWKHGNVFAALFAVGAVALLLSLSVNNGLLRVATLVFWIYFVGFSIQRFWGVTRLAIVNGTDKVHFLHEKERCVTDFPMSVEYLDKRIPFYDDGP